MRDPHLAAQKVPGSGPAGRKARRALRRALGAFPQFLDQIIQLAQGKQIKELPAGIVPEARRLLGEELDADIPPEVPHGMCPALASAWQRRAADPDTALPRWAEEGAPMGISRDIERCGIFPPVHESVAAEDNPARRVPFE